MQYDLQFSGLTVNLVHIEIGCLSHFLSETIAQVATACEVPKKTVRSLFEQAACIAVSCSYRIFNSRASPDWRSFKPPYVKFKYCNLTNDIVGNSSLNNFKSAIDNYFYDYRFMLM